MKSVLSDKHFHDEKSAYAFVESRVWPDGPVCPHCGGFDRISKMKGESTRIGTYKCYQCRKPFTVKVGTVFEASHVPMHQWLQAMFLMASSKKGISSNQLHRTLGCTLKTAWFISHRIREAMKVVGVEPLGGAGHVVEADETYFGDREIVVKRTKHGKAGLGSKRAVVALVERGGGSVRSFHVDKADKATVTRLVAQNVAPESHLHTDESRLYSDVNKRVAQHHAVVHSGAEYVRYQDGTAIHSNTAENVFSVFKRGMKGTYQHCAEKHLHRYLAEFDFRYNNRVALGIGDEARTDIALKGIVGKRLKYAIPH
jgi:transposase-like protein